ncbi:TetR/AcrR family transcriptional regulator [Fusibacter paucivorans]|uniref:TetR/AcrR family transcriptional regulator n=1 Tax=Fusibacter paucivorans TaxID=76009 RepID=A0ABS5PNE1_9FIRM|nr:TetR/AcrR family transcriptional regulator [Fusibacter paucivorans]MBS7526437.1 TetR/AcrR family transcriptional regulator [Fusibacter paucivorans]
MGKAFEEAEREKLRGALIEAGIRFFSEMPYERVKIEAIAKAVGIGKGTFYRFFDTKEALFVACTMAYEEVMQAQILKEIAAIEDGVGRLRKCLSDMLMIIREDDFIRQLIAAKGIDILSNTRTEDEKSAMFEVDVAFLWAIIGEDVKLRVSPEIAVELLRSLFYLAVLNPVIEIDVARYYDHLIHAVLVEILEAL